MKKANSQKTPTQITQDDEKVEDWERVVSDGASATQDSDRSQKALSKREIMEQLSRERFPWDE